MNRILYLLFFFLVFTVVACSTGRQVQSSLTKSNIPSSANESSLEKDYLLVEAMKYHVLGDASSALALVNQAIKRDSLCAACYYLQSDIFAGAGMYSQASEASAKAVVLDSTNQWYQLMLANVTMRTGDIPTSISQFENLLDEFGYNPDVYFNLANLYGSSSNYDAAMAMLDTLEMRERYGEQISLSRQQLYYSAGYTDKLLDEAKKLNEYSPGNPQYITLLGDAYARENENDKAKEYYDQVLAVDSLYYPAQIGLMDIYRKQNSHDEFFNELRKLCLNNRFPLEEKGRYLSLVISDPTLGKIGLPKLNDIFKEMLLANSNDWNFILLYVSYLMQTEQGEEAITVLEGYMAQPTFDGRYEVQEIYLSLLNTTQKWDKLVVKSDEVLKTNSNNMQLYMFKSVGLWQLNKLGEATKTLNTALKYTLDTTQRYDIYALMGDLYHLNGEKKKSYSSYDKALELKPDGIIVLNNYAYYLSEEGERLTDALRMSKKVIEVEPNNPTYLDTYGWILYKMGLYSEAKNTFRQAIMFGGRSESVLLDHYGDVLFALEEYDTAILYYEFALEAPDVENVDVIKAKIEKAKSLK